MTIPATREGRIAVSGSPAFEFDNPAIVANGTWIINLEENTTYGNRMRKYLPMDFIEVMNDQVETVDLIINDVSKYRVYGNGQRTVSTRPIRQVKLENQSANAISAGTMKVILERLPATADSEARRRVRGRVS